MPNGPGAFYLHHIISKHELNGLMTQKKEKWSCDSTARHSLIPSLISSLVLPIPLLSFLILFFPLVPAESSLTDTQSILSLLSVCRTPLCLTNPLFVSSLSPFGPLLHSLTSSYSLNFSLTLSLVYTHARTPPPHECLATACVIPCHNTSSTCTTTLPFSIHNLNEPIYSNFICH